MVLISVRPVSGMSETSRIVSVPLWGLWFLSNPCVNLIQMNGACFRPLVGIMVLIAFYAEEVDFLTNRVSVPLWGLWFLSNSTVALPSKLQSFRPPAGIMVLITKK